MRRYLRLYKKYFLINLKTIASYDYDTFLGIIGMIIKNIINIIMLRFIFDNVDLIAGYSYDQVLFIYSLAMCSYALWHCFFINTLTIPIYIKDGSIDNFLLKPVSILFQIMMDGFDEDGWGDLIIGLILLTVASNNLNFPITNFIIYFPIIIISSLIYAGITIILSSLCFYTIENSGLANMVSDLYNFAKYPLTIFSKPIQAILLLILPVALSAYIPSLYFFGQINIWGIILAMFFTIMYFIVAIIIFTKGLYHYSSPGN